MTIENFLDLFDRPRRSGRGWFTKCPGHADRSPSLSIAEGDGGKILLKCFAGCTAKEITAALGLTSAALFDGTSSPEVRRQAVEAKARRRRSAEIEGRRSVVRLRAECLIESAHGVDIGGWSQEKLNAALNVLGDAQDTLFAEKIENGELGF